MEDLKNENAIRLTAISFALLAGISGIISGFGLILQGHTELETHWISFIGPSFANYQDSTYSVFTVVPSFYWTGMLAIITSLASTLWAIKYIQTEAGASVMLVFVILQVLVGGGWVIDLGIAISALAIGINSPLNWWRKHIPILLSLSRPLAIGHTSDR